MSHEEFTLADNPTPFSPWMEGMTLPEIFITIPLEPEEDLTGASITLFLSRDTTDPDNLNILEKTLIELENVIGSHLKVKVDWDTTDLIEGVGQSALFKLTNVAGDEEYS